MNWHECFEYDNGALRWKVRRANCVNVGSEVGYKHAREGYIFFCRDRVQYAAHRVIWEVFNGEIPEGMEIDHINHVRDDNRIENLRLVSKSVNMENKSKYKKTKAASLVLVLIPSMESGQLKLAKRDMEDIDDIEHAKICEMIARAELGYHDNHGDYFK